MTAADLPPVGGFPQDVPPAVLREPRTATPAADATPVEPVGAPHADRLPADTLIWADEHPDHPGHWADWTQTAP